MSLEFIKLFADKMRNPVNPKNLAAYIKEQNFRDIENIGLLIG
jgi:hypothetical protein